MKTSERRSSVQSIAQAPRGRRTRVLPEHAHNRETPRSSIVVSDRRSCYIVCSSHFEFDLPNLYPNE